MNGMTAGASADTRITSGSSVHSTGGIVPTTITPRPPIANPSTVPTIARTIVAPVVVALVRSTDSAPNPIQNAFCASKTLASSTASASPMAPRTLFCSQTE